ncbi:MULTISPECIES: Pycsar system effector family protein [Empedobacter]|uniref:Pycsar system effector family protein n=1 Tax=Empedobacter TaxID=59734 RepID=UPI001C574793|nr:MULTISPECIES: Pycsar system effector family protein [Empedobacter]MBW1619175.1 HD domain-containing protein [Empedobacter falsenii]MDM1138934.1 HD domain-containing protein [Empedobacter sp. R132-2]
MNQLLLNIENYVFNLFKDNLSLDFTYHNFMHTVKVVEAIKTLSTDEQISTDLREKLLIAGWFHDTGYTKIVQGHESESANIAKEYLIEHNFDENYIKEVQDYILITALNNVPKNIGEAIVKDADNYHLGQTEYPKISELLRDEIAKICHKEFSDYEWHVENRNFFLNIHHFYTDAAKKLWQKGKEENLIFTQNKIKEIELIGDIPNKYEIKKKKNDKIQQPDRGVDTLFRVTLNNHTRLSDIADSKANILLSVNAIVISIALSTLVPKLGSPKNEYLLLPSIVMLLSSVVSIIFAILATKPNVTYESFNEEDVKNKKVNLLFFGNFYQMSLEAYDDAMQELMKDRDYVYTSLTRDLYYLGKVLERKYRLLSITYTIFMIGTILSVLTFAYAMITNVA